MNKFITLLCAALISTASSFAFTSCTIVTGSGNIVKQSREAKPAEEIHVSAGLTCHITQGENFEVTVETDDNIQDYILVYNSGDALHIKRKSNVRYNATTNVYVTTPHFSEVSASAGCTVFVGEWTTNKAEGSANSGATLNIKSLTANEAEFSSNSGATLNASVYLENLEASASSGATINLGGKANDTELSANSGASINTECEYKELEASASSGGNINYKKYTDRVEISRSSGGNVWGN